MTWKSSFPLQPPNSNGNRKKKGRWTIFKYLIKGKIMQQILAKKRVKNPKDLIHQRGRAFMSPVYHSQVSIVDWVPDSRLTASPTPQHYATCSTASKSVAGKPDPHLIFGRQYLISERFPRQWYGLSFVTTTDIFLIRWWPLDLFRTTN